MPSDDHPGLAEDVGGADLDRLVEVALPAVRAIVAVAVRSLDASPVPVTLAQYRVLVIMGQQGPTRAATLATLLGVDASTVTRMCDRLVRDGLVIRGGERTDRRAVRVVLSPTGKDVVDRVMARRREEFGALLRAIPGTRRAGVVAALREIDTASGAAAVVPPAVLGWIA
ncbi:MAG: MarR family transcriptional regulator [Actinomycetota bacterium]|nr:MarR family transcriptional regulator [Actinomycetota bacterium]